ncbi:MAG TPA: hypothetical protein VFY73_15160 [Ideonella sp.]|jgi:hypothetical protein|uniref:hypothetical protein n=1 Tax=Ideonella sp. TaxID=1929293 RepID=UPI002E34D8D0|nr:hypothetical protein [Ideonella sp.]HEX5685361.1 hypothetical protein [Ideonella sp.]
MAEVRVQVPDEIMAELKSTLGLRTNTDIVEEALTMLNWAAEEKKNGRQIFSARPDGKDVTRLAMRSLMNGVRSTV